MSPKENGMMTGLTESGEFTESCDRKQMVKQAFISKDIKQEIQFLKLHCGSDRLLQHYVSARAFFNAVEVK
jgi:hypothetical protein